jgi:hypothetical protein
MWSSRSARSPLGGSSLPGPKLWPWMPSTRFLVHLKIADRSGRILF